MFSLFRGNGHLSPVWSVLNVYSVRIMLGLVASLGLLLLLLHLPVHHSTESQARVGWTPRADRIPISEIESQNERAEGTQNEAGPPGAPPPTRHTVSPSSSPPSSRQGPAEGRTSSEDEQSNSLDDVRSVAALDVNDQTPHIIGGRGALYLHIEYPEEARQKGIEGRLQLEFTVDTTGTAKEIEVVDSLYPPCDSAAIRAVRSVRFAPATHNGRRVPVRMRLPIKFQLLAVSSAQASANESPDSVSSTNDPR